MKVKKGQLLQLWYVFEGIKNQKQNIKFSYFVAKNKLTIKDEIDLLNEAQEVPETFQLYDRKRADLAADMADRVPSTGQPKTENGQYIIIERKDEFDEELAKLKKQYAKVIEQRNKQIEAFKEILEEETEFEGHQIKLRDIPQAIEPSVLEILLQTNLISEDEG